MGNIDDSTKIIIELSNDVATLNQWKKGNSKWKEQVEERLEKVEKNQKRLLKFVNIIVTVFIIISTLVQWFGFGNIVDSVFTLEEKRRQEEVKKDAHQKQFSNGFGSAL